jgi:hypothetical protein
VNELDRLALAIDKALDEHAPDMPAEQRETIIATASERVLELIRFGPSSRGPVLAPGAVDAVLNVGRRRLGGG